jgi:hypothetical protein
MVFPKENVKVQTVACALLPKEGVVSVPPMNRTYVIYSWNVRGLGDHDKCADVLMELLSSNLDIILLQETKLSRIPPLKLSSFLPHRLKSCYSPSDSASGGVLIAWSYSVFTLLGSSSTHTLRSPLLHHH